jgi:hypothetical protein
MDVSSSGPVPLGTTASKGELNLRSPPPTGSGCACGLLWGVEPHYIPIGEQWGSRIAGLPKLLVALVGSSGRGAPVESEPGPAAVRVTSRPTAHSRKPAGSGSQLWFDECWARTRGLSSTRVEGLVVGPVEVLGRISAE